MRTWTWDDSSRIVNLFNLHLLRAHKYGLDIPIQRSHGLTKEELKTREDELVAFFLHELRKPKSVAN